MVDHWYRPKENSMDKANSGSVVEEARKVFPRACSFKPVTDDLHIIGWTFRTKTWRLMWASYSWATASGKVFPDKSKSRQEAEGVMRTVVRDNGSPKGMGL